MTQATPGPWKIEYAEMDQAWIVDATGEIIVGFTDDDKAFWETIVRAVNDHPELIAALERAIDLIGDWGAYAPNYFQEKHGLDSDIAGFRAILEKAKAK